MTLTSTTVKDTYTGDGSTTAFAITFVFWDNSDIQAISTTSGTDTTLTLDTHYTLAGGSGSTGTLTTTSGNTIASGTTLTIKSNRADTQPTSLPAGGALPASSVEQALDQNVRLIQQFAEEITRVIKLSDSSTDTGTTFPDHTGNASKLIVVNSGATGYEAVTLASIDSSAITTPVSLANGGTATDLSSPTALDMLRITSGASGVEGRSLDEVVADLFIKGGDIASADPLVIDTDGHYFDVTGTTGFSSMTVAAGRLFMLQFDGALTMTDGASLDLGGANITTHAGCRGLFYATAANTVQLVVPFFFEGDQRRVDSAGAVTNAVQPAFAAANSALSNVTGAGTQYTVVFDAEHFDQGGDYDGTSTFTAPITGRYLLSATVQLQGITSAIDEIELRISTSNRQFSNMIIGTNINRATHTLSITALENMDNADTATVTIEGTGEAGDVHDIAGGAAHFSGVLLV